MNKSRTASVVIATYNRESVLCETLAQVRDQEYRPDEVHIVDHTENHTEDTINFINSLPKWFSHHRLSEGGLCEARNYGLKVSSGDIIIYIDDDVTLSESFIKSHIEPYDDPDIGAVAGQTLTPRDPEPVEKPPEGRTTWYGQSKMRLNSNQTGTVLEGRGCNMSFRSGLLEEIGGFDTNLDYRDESDVFHRIREHGNEVHFNPDASLYHQEDEEGGTVFNSQISRQELKEIAQNESYYQIKNVSRGSIPVYILFAVLRQGKRRGIQFYKLPGDIFAIVKGIRKGVENISQVER